MKYDAACERYSNIALNIHTAVSALMCYSFVINLNLALIQHPGDNENDDKNVIMMKQRL